MSKKTENRWMTHNQLEVLEKIAATGRQGIKLWYTDLALATIRSLCKRGLADTRRNGRIVVTWAGKRRLKEPWPPAPVTGSDHASDAQSGSESG